ncbi:MAG: hypothetical protein CXZ00_09170 [Acidobacteria bacterium]|nr:MAG: hypothetical protein CXZ00_09170 [Acidobacteriota bacterium]
MVSFKELPYVAQIGLVVLVILLLAAGVFFSFLRPIAKANEADALLLKSKQAEIAQLAPYKTKLAELTAQTEKLNRQMEAQRQIVPEEKEVPTLITLVEHESKATGVKVRRYKPKDIATKEYYVEVPFEIDVDGPYYSVLSFYDHIQKMERIVNVSNLVLGALKGGKAPGKAYKWAPNETVSASCVLTTFYSNPKAGPPPAAAKKK